MLTPHPNGEQEVSLGQMRQFRILLEMSPTSFWIWRLGRLKPTFSHKKDTMISQQRNDVHDLNDLTKDQNDAHLRFAQVQLTTISNNDFYVSQTSLLEMDGLILRKKRGIGHNSTKKTGQHSWQHMTTLNTSTDTSHHLQYMCFPAFQLFPDIFVSTHLVQ